MYYDIIYVLRYYGWITFVDQKFAFIDRPTRMILCSLYLLAF